MKNIIKLVTGNLFCFIVLMTAFGINVNAQNKKDLTEFNVTFENTDAGLNLKCTEGCAWTTLSLKSDGNTAGYKVDGYGIVDENSNAAKLPTFGFMVKKSENQVMLIGMNGTSWKDLKFSLIPNKNVSIDEMGMVK